MLRFLLFILVCCCSLFSLSQSPGSFTSSEILLHLKKLNVLGTVLYIAAHPDDENTRLMAYLANDKLYRTGYLSLTRGDGGQNLIGDEQGVELGLIRTQELLAARRIDGAEQFFSRAYDFGFSKNPEETFKVWDKDKILSDVVWVIRKFQPDVIITRFPTTGEGGHGHHTASAILAGEAFDAAADPGKYPEQFQYGVKPWKVKRLLWNTFNFGGNNTQREDQLKIEVGGYNALLGKSSGEIAAESRSQHKSQGFGVPRSRGSQLEYFKTIKGEPPFADLVDGIDETWMRVKQGNNNDPATVKNLIDHAVLNYSFEHPENIVPDLVKIYKAISNLQDGYWKSEKLNEVVKLIEQCSGFFIEATTSQQYVVQGDSLKINLLLNNRLGVDAKHPNAHLSDSYFVLPNQLNKNVNLRQSIAILVGDKAITQPYWLEKPLDKGNFVVNTQLLIGKPENDPPTVKLTIDISGETISFEKPIQYKTNDPVRGELYQPLVILPKLEVNYSSKTYLTINRNPVKVRSFATANASLNNFTIKNIHSQNVREIISAGSRDYESVSMFSVNNDSSDYREVIKAVASDGKNSWSSYRKTIQYDHIPTIVYFPPAESQLVALDLKTSGNNIGYIAGAGDKVPDALELMGYTVITLSQKDITTAGLHKFDAIITGVRAYNVHDWLSNDHEILMNYVKEGGVLLVQYNVNGLTAKIGPYPFTISGHRITDEEAKVTFLAPDHPVMNFPNKIIQKDFDGWIQERSTYNAENPDPKYQAIFSMNDPGEAEQKGSLIVADYGKGRFIYSGLVFFRELPAGIPGAYRLFANLLAKRQMTNKGSLNR